MAALRREAGELSWRRKSNEIDENKRKGNGAPEFRKMHSIDASSEKTQV
jgi:hypothetical protein